MLKLQVLFLKWRRSIHCHYRFRVASELLFAAISIRVATTVNTQWV